MAKQNVVEYANVKLLIQLLYGTFSGVCPWTVFICVVRPDWNLNLDVHSVHPNGLKNVHTN